MSYEPHHISTFLIYINLFLVIFMCVNWVFNKAINEGDDFNKYKPKPPKKVKKVKKRPRRIWRVD